MAEVNVKGVLEALLFVSEGPLTLEQMRELDNEWSGNAGPPSNLVPIVIIVLLAVVAAGLALALVLR